MLVKMLETRMGSPDGLHVRHYEAGGQFDLPVALALIFIGEGWALEPEKSPARARKKKNAGAAPENKARSRTPTKKSSLRKK